MAKNPMQKKTRNSFIFGALMMFVIMGLVSAVLAYMLIQLKSAENDRVAKQKSVFVMTSSVASGNAVDSSMLKQTKVDSSVAPSDAVTLGDFTENTIAKIDLTKGVIVTSAMISEKDNEVKDSLRVQEYNMINIPSQIATGDFIDIRLRMPDGHDYIVVSKKKVEIPTINGIDSLNTIWVKLTEDETILMSNAIVEAYQMEGALLYTTKYVEPGMQQNATPTYVPSAEVLNLITQNPNIEQEAKQAIYSRYNGDAAGIRNNINSELNSVDSDTRKSNTTSGVSTETQTTKEQRQLSSFHVFWIFRQPSSITGLVSASS